MMKRLVAGALGVAMLVIAGCGGAAQTGSAPATNSAKTGNTTAAPKEFKVGLVTDTGGLNDHGFNHLANLGLQKAEQQLGVKGSVVESKQESDYVPNLTQFAQKGYDVVVAVGFLMDGAVKQVAKQYPNTKFIIIDDPITDQPNVASAMFKTEQAGYLAGALAGYVQTQKALPGLKGKNTVGVVGGMKIPPVDDYIVGFQAGYKATNPNGNVLIGYDGKFDDPSGGKAMALSQIAKGADIVFQVAGGTGLGVIEAAKDQKVYAIGVDADQNYLGPDTVITSALKRVDEATFLTIKAAKEGNFKSGIAWFDLTNDGVGIANPIAAIPADIASKIATLKQEIAAGKVQIPNARGGK